MLLEPWFIITVASILLAFSFLPDPGAVSAARHRTRKEDAWLARQRILLDAFESTERWSPPFWDALNALAQHQWCMPLSLRSPGHHCLRLTDLDIYYTSAHEEAESYHAAKTSWEQEFRTPYPPPPAYLHPFLRPKATAPAVPRAQAAGVRARRLPVPSAPPR